MGPQDGPARRRAPARFLRRPAAPRRRAAAARDALPVIMRGGPERRDRWLRGPQASEGRALRALRRGLGLSLWTRKGKAPAWVGTLPPQEGRGQRQPRGSPSPQPSACPRGRTTRPQHVWPQVQGAERREGWGRHWEVTVGMRPSPHPPPFAAGRGDLPALLRGVPGRRGEHRRARLRERLPAPPSSNASEPALQGWWAPRLRTLHAHVGHGRRRRRRAGGRPAAALRPAAVLPPRAGRDTR